MRQKRFRLLAGVQPQMQRIASALVALAILFAPTAGAAETVEQLRQQLDQSSGQVDSLRSEVSEHAEAAATLQEALDHLNAQVASLRGQINATNASIAKVNAQIVQIEAQMAEKKAILAEYLKRDYFLSNQTTLEVLVSSESLSDYVDRKQYLESSQNRVQELIAEIEAIKKTMEAEKAKLTALGEQLNQQKAGLDAQVAKQQELLAKTRGEQAAYQKLLEEAEAARERIISNIQSMTQTGDFPSQGYVSKGQIVGREGSSGFSTGNHLHFSVYINGAHQNPWSYLNSGKMQWPEDCRTMTQNYGPASWSNPMYSFHDGLDISCSWNAPIYAAASGNIFRGYQAGGFGNYVMIQHADGAISLYGHMQP